MRDRMDRSVKRLPAFTMLELIIAMLISAIVIATAYTGLKLVIKNMKTYSERHDELAAVLRLDELLRKDVENAIRVSMTDDKVDLAMDTVKVSYRFSSMQVIRTGAKTDTFAVRSNVPRFHYKGALVEDGPSQDAIDEITFDILINGQTLPFRYRKYYSSTELFNISEHAIDRSSTLSKP
jgi:prepilin-type N-terminal cleavage/methylation domain-containing protein